MKIEYKDRGFSPIILTIESQMELDVLSELVALASFVHKIPQDVKDFVSKTSDELLNMGVSADFHYFCDYGSTLVAKQPNTL